MCHGRAAATASVLLPLALQVGFFAVEPVWQCGCCRRYVHVQVGGWVQLQWAACQLQAAPCLNCAPLPAVLCGPVPPPVQCQDQGPAPGGAAGAGRLGCMDTAWHAAQLHHLARCAQGQLGEDEEPDPRGPAAPPASSPLKLLPWPLSLLWRPAALPPRPLPPSQPSSPPQQQAQPEGTPPRLKKAGPGPLSGHTRSSRAGGGGEGAAGARNASHRHHGHRRQPSGGHTHAGGCCAPVPAGY
jgi:hypothetical protein